MMLEGQLAQSVGSAQLQPVPPDLFGASPLPDVNLLGNAAIQVLDRTGIGRGNLADAYYTLLAPVGLSRLALIKREKFTVEGRADRIQKSLAALNSRQPTDLSLAQWKAVLAETEDED